MEFELSFLRRNHEVHTAASLGEPEELNFAGDVDAQASLNDHSWNSRCLKALVPSSGVQIEECGRYELQPDVLAKVSAQTQTDVCD